VTSFPLVNTAQAKNVSQNWKATHEQINDDPPTKLRCIDLGH